MELEIAENILKEYGFSTADVQIHQIGSGHINRTYLLSTSDQKYILQNINPEVFKQPEAIAHNISVVAQYLHTHYPEYLFPSSIKTAQDQEMVQYENEYWRLMPYVPHTVALDTLSDPKQAYEAAKQFGKLSRLLNHFDSSQLQLTIPGFHDLELRYVQFTQALDLAPTFLKQSCEKEIEQALHHHYILNYFNSYQNNPDFQDRVMHHDTKISNVLLDAQTFNGVCVIDLDTLMPGKFISDLGDMMRTYLCAFSENETDLDKINIRLPYFSAMIEGYLSEMKDILTSVEKELILFSGKYIIYMQALRFLTDYLNGNIYYPIKYATQNLDRAKNQFRLLHELNINEKELQDIIESYLI
ncbi:phosphotransferase enzyme family protein [Pedobacter montanisoli]|uniref:Aminoglycoside phosphotransferase family protein n=1 Tax=Pedobacter montanisoli TaxID=2923277 RepID=A0ABS9ZVL5_9SPHI|nr:aminoglycoside phosphotransferase family protein [Pedobacter montanisoli]MCJ0742289.1 aminoglycoside phosphotransferase family protein [Pedobacter montanisoli]